MPSATRVSAVWAFVALALSFPHAQVAPTAPAPTGVVVGVVVDYLSGKPIPDAVVTISLRQVGMPDLTAPPSPGSQRVLTDPTGRFAFTGLAAAGWVADATKSGYSPSRTNLDLREGERVTNASISLTKFASITGRITDDLGDPVVGLTVRAHRRVYTSGQPRLDYGTIGYTDDRGMYRIAVLLPGEYVIVVPFTQVTLTYAATSEYMAAAYGDRELSADMLWVARPPPALDALGSPDAQRVGDRVLLSAPNTYYPPDPGDPRRARGYQTTFAPSTPDAGAATAIALQAGEERSGLDVRLTLVTTVTVSGTVLGPSGPVSRAGVALVPASGQLPDDLTFAWASALADASGAFTFLNVPAGRYTLRGVKVPPRSEGFAETYRLWSDQSLTVGEAPVDGVVVTLQRPVRVTGQLKFEGASQPTADELQRQQPLFRLRGLNRNEVGVPIVDPTLTFATREVAGGRYVITSATAGTWSLKSAMWQGKDITRTPVDLRDDISGVVATFTDRPAQVTGSVRTAQGAAETTATVLLVPADPSAWTEPGFQFLSTGTTPTGAYAFSRVQAGDYLVLALVEAPSAKNAVDVPGVLRDWRNPAFLRAVSGMAVRVRVADGETVTQDLKTTVIR